METILVKAILVILSNKPKLAHFNREKGMSDCEGHGHKAVVYKSHFLPLRHSVVTETPARYLANKPHLTKDQVLCSLCPHERWKPQVTTKVVISRLILSHNPGKALRKWLKTTGTPQKCGNHGRVETTHGNHKRVETTGGWKPQKCGNHRRVETMHGNYKRVETTGGW